MMFIRLLFCVISFLFLGTQVFSAQLEVENIFSDIDRNYPYLDQLQLLYDGGTIVPDEHGAFNPTALLTREEFVGILTEISCEECIQPDVSLDLIQTYANTQPFFDVYSNNQYFYCIAGASDRGYVSGYQPGSVCDDGTSQSGGVPFCPNNTILLEEALAVVLRASGILTNQQADLIRSQIENNQITADLSDDVSVRNEDGSVYSFYPDFQRALEYELLDVDPNGNEQIYRLIEKQNNKLYPDSLVTREDFLQIAYVILRANNCRDIQENNLAIDINIYDETCSEGSNCVEGDIRNIGNTDVTTFDFGSEIQGVCESGVSDPDGYIWRFLNQSTGQEVFRYGRYVDNYDFATGGDWRVIFRVVDRCGNTGEVYNSLSFPGGSGDVLGGDVNLLLDINIYDAACSPGSNCSETDTDLGSTDDTVFDFDSEVYGVCESGVSDPNGYVWRFLNESTGQEVQRYGKYIDNYDFATGGDWVVILEVTDQCGNTGEVHNHIVFPDGSTDTSGENINLMIDINVYDESCSQGLNCSEADVDLGNTDDTVFDFGSEVNGVCASGVLDPDGYIWRFLNQSTGQEVQRYGKYIDNYDFATGGDWVVRLDVTDQCGNTGSTYNTLSFIGTSPIIESQQDDLSVSIEADPIYGAGPLQVGLNALVSGGSGKYSYVWDFGDGNSGIGSTIDHIFTQIGTYEIELVVSDTDDNTLSATLLVSVVGISCGGDRDGDGVNDCDDVCPGIAGDSANAGCPLFEQICTQNSDCSDGYICDSNQSGQRICQLSPSKTHLHQSCLYDGGSAFVGNTSCTSCPCDQSIDFISSLRPCDIIFPAITSPDGSEIYSRGSVFQIPQ